MPIPELLGLTRLAKPLTSAEGNRILERDRYRCQYCGLDGLASFENSLIMTVDFLHPGRAKGRKPPSTSSPRAVPATSSRATARLTALKTPRHTS